MIFFCLNSKNSVSGVIVISPIKRSVCVGGEDETKGVFVV